MCGRGTTKFQWRINAYIKFMARNKLINQNKAEGAEKKERRRRNEENFAFQLFFSLSLVGAPAWLPFNQLNTRPGLKGKLSFLV